MNSLLLKIRKKFFNRLQNGGYPCRFLSEIFSEIHYGSHRKYLSRSKDKISVVDRFLRRSGNDFDVAICYKAWFFC